MASLLGNLIFAGQQTLLTTQANLGSVGVTANLYSINSAAVGSVAADVALFQPAYLAQLNTFGGGASIGVGGCTLTPLLYTRTSTVAVFFNPNTTALPGEILLPYFHSRVR